MKIALVSLSQIWENKQENYKMAYSYIKKHHSKCDLFVFPEMTFTGFSMNVDKIGEDENESETINLLSDWAKEFKVALVFGLLINKNKKAVNRIVFMSKKGEVSGFYDKIHLFSPASEDKFFEEGKSIKTIDFQSHKIGLTICYDLRFGELYSLYQQKGVDIVINIANWPKERVCHWKTLLAARAIENQYIVVGVNRVGIDNKGLKHKESSLVYNANGDKLKAVFKRKNFKIFELDKNFAQRVKEKLNFARDKKPNLYTSLNKENKQ